MAAADKRSKVVPTRRTVTMTSVKLVPRTLPRRSGLESIVANSDVRADLKSDLRGFGFYSLGISKDRT